MTGLTFSDAAHLEALRKQLWAGQAFGKAAVLVGAGLSLNAERLNSSAHAMPTFNELAATMWRQIHMRRAAAVPPGLDPVEIASDYEAIFDRHGLDACLTQSIVDAAYRPARLHRLLMSLPWADVFTTNWDTILERAAIEVTDRQYAIVASKESLVATHRPRIVKLHGSFPDRRPFVVTKEDFRGYPRTHAAFVNTVQQAVMECALCLLGFGGKDPNFLAWAGWVHDNLGSSAPPIYLAGVLDLDALQRKVLAHRRVIPIDLGELFPRSQWGDRGVRHRHANEWLLLNLAQGNLDPLEWPSLIRRTASARWTPDAATPALLHPSDEPVVDAEATIPECVTAMERYPGWLVCPSQHAESAILMLRSERDELDAAMRSDDIEVSLRSWRAYFQLARVTCHPIPVEDLHVLAPRLLAWQDDSDRWFELATMFLSQCRFARLWTEHNEWLARLERPAEANNLRVAELCRERALAALDTLNYADLRSALDTWPKLPGAFRLEIARATTTIEAMQLDKARGIVQEVLHSIRRAEATTEATIELLSLEGVAMDLERLLEFASIGERVPRGPSPYGRHRELSNWDCDARALFDSFRNKLLRERPRHVRHRKGFDVGRSTMHISSHSGPEQVDDAQSALLLYETSLMPPRCGRTTFFSDLLAAATSAIASVDPGRAFSALVRAQAFEAFDEQVNARLVARLSADQVSELRTMATRLTTQRGGADGAGDAQRWEQVVAMGIEMRSRLVARGETGEAEALLLEAIELTKLPDFFNTHRLSRSALATIERAFQALNSTDRERLVVTLLDVPLPPENAVTAQTRTWKDPIRVVRLPKGIANVSQGTWRTAVEHLLIIAASESSSWPFALSRLLELSQAGLLSGDSGQRFNAVFWRRFDDGSLGEFLSRMSYTHLALLAVNPGAEEREMGAALRSALLTQAFPQADGSLGSERNDAEATARNRFHEIASVLKRTGTRLGASEASRFVGRVAEWLRVYESRQADPVRALTNGMEPDRVLDSVAKVLRVHVLPELQQADVEATLLETLRETLQKNPSTRASCEAQFRRLGTVDDDHARRTIVRALRSSSQTEMLSGVTGALDWLRFADQPEHGLLAEVVGAFERPFGPTTAIALGTLARSILQGSIAVEEPILGRLVDLVAWLLETTDLRVADNDDRYDDPDWMAEARVSAAFAASVLWAKYPAMRKRLEAWRESATTDYLSAVREAWKAGQNDG